MLPCVDCAQWDMGSTAATRHMEPWTQEDNENIAMGDSVIHTPSSNPEPINITWSFPILNVFNSKPKKNDFGGWCGKKNTGVGFCRSGHFGRSGVEKTVQKALKKAFKTVRKRKKFKKKRSGVEITVQEFFFSIFS